MIKKEEIKKEKKDDWGKKINDSPFDNDDGIVSRTFNGSITTRINSNVFASALAFYKYLHKPFVVSRAIRQT